MFVVFDSNIWISQRGLHSSRALEGLEFIKSKNAILAVPEVVRLEVETKLQEKLLSHKNKIGESFRYISTVLVEEKEIALPTRQKIEECVRGLVEDTGVRIRELSLTMEAARSSLHKILHKLQPSAKGEQFADGVIWANCLELLQESDVCLVSEDKAFYKDYDYNHGLASNLAEEAQKCSNKLRLFASLEDLLQDARRDVHRVWPTDEVVNAPYDDTENQSTDETV